MSGSSLTGALLDEQQKSDQIALHVYTKLFHVVYEARALVEGVGERERERERDRERDNKERDRDRDRRPKTDRWFNLETPDSDFFPRELRETYKAISATGSPAPLFIHVLLSVPKSNSSAGAGNGNVLVALAQANTPGTDARIRIEPTPRYVLLEKWELKFIPRSSLDHAPSSPIRQQGSSGQGADDGAVALPTIYKHGIPLFRSLYSLLRILPVWKLYKRLRRRTTGPSTSQLSIQLRLSDRDQVDGVDGDILLFDIPPSPTHPPLPTQTQEFPPIPHPLGSFKLSTTYLESPTFQLDDLESLLSSRFLNEGFVPTLTSKPRLEATAAGTTSSSIASPAESIAEKFVIPPQPSPLSPGGVGAKSGAGSGAGSSSSPPPPGHGHFSHLRQPSMSGQYAPQAQPHHSHPQSQHSQQQHRADGSIGGRSPSPTTLPVLSRLRLESSPGRRAGSLPSPSSPIAPALPVPATALTIPPTTPSSTVAGPVAVPAPISGLGLALGPAQHSFQGISFPQAQSLPAPPQLPSTTLLQSQSPLHQSSSSSAQPGTQSLPIKRLSTINPFKANTLLGGGTGGGSPVPGSGSGSGPGLGLLLGQAQGQGQGQGQGPAHSAPGTSSGSVHSVHSPRHASSPLGHVAVGGESSLSSHSSALSQSQLQQQYHHQHQQPPQPLHPFPTTQHSPQPPYSPPPQSGSLGLGLGPVFGSGSSSSLGSGFPHSPSSPVPPPQKLGQGQGQQPPSTPTVPMLGQPGQRKRYSSSFSHRYTASGSVGSAVGGISTSTGSASPVGASPALGSPLSGPGTREGRESPSPGFVEDVGKPRSRSSSFLGKRTEDDDISMFMQDIETRKPLSGRWRMSAHEREGSGDGDLETDGSGGRHGKERSDGTDGTAKAGGGSIASEVTTKGSRGETSPSASLYTGPLEGNVGEADMGASHRRASYTYQSYPHRPSPLSPRPRAPHHSPQAQAQAQLQPHSPASPTHGRHRSSGSPPRPPPVATTTTAAGSTATPSGGSGAAASLPSTSPPGAIPTSQAEVDVRLKKMNETFLKSLAGFGDGWAGSSASGTRSGDSRGSSIERRSEDGIGTPSTSTSASTSTRGGLGHPGRGRDRDRVVPGGLVSLSQQGSEEVIGAIELGPEGRQHSLEREQLRVAMGSLKSPSLMRHRGH